MDEKFDKEKLDSSLNMYTIFTKIGMIRGVIINVKNGLIDESAALSRIEKIVNSIKDF